jgi:hypothetical protein
MLFQTLYSLSPARVVTLGTMDHTPARTRDYVGGSRLRRSIGGSAIDGLEEGRSLEDVNRLRYLRFDELSFTRGNGTQGFVTVAVDY